MSFTIGNLAQDAFIKLDNIQTSNDGLRAFLKIFLDLKLRPSRHDKNTTSIDFIDIHANLVIVPKNSLISTVICQSPINLFDKEIETGVWLNFNLDDASIFAIQKFRKGDDLKFRLDYKFTVLIKEAFEPIKDDHIWSTEYVHNFRGETQITIPKSTWSERLLPGLGYPGFKLIEIPLTHSLLKEVYSDIIEEFNLGQEYFNKGDYNKCVSHCRNTLDKLNGSLKELKKNISSKSKFIWLQKIDKATFTWIDTLDQSTFGIASGAHHSGLKKQFTRVEAESIYLVTLGLMNFIGQASWDYK